MLRGISTMNLWADDLPAATRWYTELLGIEPYLPRCCCRGPRAAWSRPRWQAVLGSPVRLASLTSIALDALAWLHLPEYRAQVTEQPPP